MAEGRSRQQWDHTSELLAMLANGLCRGAGKPAFRSNQFHPYRKKAAVQTTPATSERAFKILEKVLVDGAKKNRGRSTKPRRLLGRK